VPVDPVCGIELDEDLALLHDHDGKIFTFVVMVAEKSLSKNHVNTRIIPRLEMLRTFYKILNL